MNVKIYLDNKPDKDQNCQIFFVVTGSGKRAKISSGIKVNPKNFSGNTIARKEPSADLKNAILQAKVSLLNKIIAEASLKIMDITPDQLKKAFLDRMDKEAEKDKLDLSGKHLVVSYLMDYEKSYAPIHKHNTVRGIKQVRDHIEKFDPTITLEDINHTWLNKYCGHLVILDMQDSTIKDRHLKVIKSACREAARNGIQISDQVDKFRWKSQPKQPFFATWEEVEKIAKITDFVMPIMEKVRDLFIISCYTGLRDSDIRMITPQSIFKQGGHQMLRIKMVKTGFDYSIPMAEQVVKILKKYDYKPPLVSQQKYNQFIKKVAQIVTEGQAAKSKSSGNKSKIELVNRSNMFTTHTGRRTFGRRFLDRGGSLVVLSKIFGHSDTSTTLRYIGYQPQEVVSEFVKVFC
jgi:integrase